MQNDFNAQREEQKPAEELTAAEAKAEHEISRRRVGAA